MFGDRDVLDREGLRLLLDVLGEDRHRLGAGLHVVLHRLDEAGGLVGDQLAVRLDLPEHLVGERAITVVEMLERRGDVMLDLLELGPDDLDAVQGRRLRDLADRRAPRPPSASREARPVSASSASESSSRAARSGERLEPLVARGQQTADRLITREQGDDALLFGACVGGRGSPDLAGDLTHQAGGLLLDRRQAVGEALVDDCARRTMRSAASLARHAWFVVVALEAVAAVAGTPPRAAELRWGRALP